MHKTKQTVFKLFFPKSSGIPPSLRYGATLPALRTRRSSKSEGGFRRQPENSAARARDLHGGRGSGDGHTTEGLFVNDLRS